MRHITLLFLILFLASCKETDRGITVSDNGRHLVAPDGTAFFYLGDTAWELFHKLDRDEATRYLQNRAEKGFTVIQAVVLAENDGLRVPNSYGEVPFHELDPTQPNEKYFEHVDFIVRKAAELGLVMGMLPTWGDKVTGFNGGAGPQVFDVSNARTFGAFLGSRYSHSPVIWILGGDRNVNSPQELEIWRSMALGIGEGDGGRNPISYHPRGASNSSFFLHNEDWLDFNMYQSGHTRHFEKVYEYAIDAFLLQPPKPVVDGEPAYEDIAVEFWKYCDWLQPLRVPEEVLDGDRLIADLAYFEQGYFGPHDVRVHAYWNLLSGACGYTYGNNAVWQMFKKGGTIAIPCLTDWEEALDRPGADDMRHVRALFESRPFEHLMSDQSLVYGTNPENEDHVRAALAEDASFALLYSPRGKAIPVVMDKVKGEQVKSWWFDPGEGVASGPELVPNRGIRTFTPPSEGAQQDWVLVLDAETSGLPAPGVY